MTTLSTHDMKADVLSNAIKNQVRPANSKRVDVYLIFKHAAIDDICASWSLNKAAVTKAVFDNERFKATLLASMTGFYVIEEFEIGTSNDKSVMRAIGR